MGNTNFQTIHQMGTAISDMVRQATGRDDVQNIDMEHVTVAQNHRYEEIDLSGQVVSFQAGEAGLPFEKLAVQIKPVQDLHGYDNPWPGGGGKNLINAALYNLPVTITRQTTIADYLTSEQIKWTVAAKVTNNGSVNGRLNIILNNGNALVRTTYKSIPVGTTDSIISVSVDASGYTFTRVVLAISGETSGYSITVSDIQISKGDEVDKISPYSNICPITGWTMVNVYQAGENMEDARVYRFTFPSEAGIVYGGTLDATTGMLSVTWAGAQYDGSESGLNWFETYKQISFNLPAPAKYSSTEISYKCNRLAPCANDRRGYNIGNYATLVSRGGMVAFSTPNDTLENALTWLANNPPFFAYELATPITYHLTPQEITTLLGQNYIWADTGDTEVKFTNVKELY